MTRRGLHPVWRILALLASLLQAACALPPAAAVADAVVGRDNSRVIDPAGQDAGRLVIVAVSDGAQARPAAGGTGRGTYRLGAGYAGSDAAQALADVVASHHALTEVSAWTIDALRLRCMLYRLAPGADRDSVLRRLADDPRVQLAQPLNTFETLTHPTTGTYDDPYLGLQVGWASLGTAQAQRSSRGEGVRIAVIDTQVDATHPDLAHQVSVQRDAAPGVPNRSGESHGTQVAGIIAAQVNNGIGIAGVAPAARVLSYRACWAAPAPAQGARCDSYSLAQALSQALADQADVINLSLGGPADPLLQRLTEVALKRGLIVVGALPTQGRPDGFPSAVPGVLVAAVAEDGSNPPGTLAAPGRDVLTLRPGGGYDYASGSSMAAAHVSAAVALLLALDPRLHPAEAQLALAPAGGAGPIDLCRALRRLPGVHRCDADAAP